MHLRHRIIVQCESRFIVRLAVEGQKEDYLSMCGQIHTALAVIDICASTDSTLQYEYINSVAKNLKIFVSHMNSDQMHSVF
jgi:hypothetical protein